MTKDSTPYKLGVLGGGIGSAIGYTHLSASQVDHRFSVTAACFSRNQETNRATALKWGVEKEHLYSCWEELLDSEKDNIDAVVIMTPTPLHYEQVMKALKAGYAVICEKPLAASLEENKKICELAAELNSFLAVTHNYTGYPMLRELQHMVKSGHLGKVHNIAIEMPQEGFARLDADGNKPKPQEWRLQDGAIPSVSLDLGTHLQHMIYFLTGENPVELVAEQSSNGWFPQIIDDVSCIANYASGMKSQMWYSKCALGYRNGLRVRVFGTRGSAEWYQMRPEELQTAFVDGEISTLDRGGKVEIANQERYTRFKAGHPAGFIEAFANLYMDIADELDVYLENNSKDSSWVYGEQQALAGLNVFEAIKKSSESKKWIKLEQTL